MVMLNLMPTHPVRVDDDYGYYSRPLSHAMAILRSLSTLPGLMKLHYHAGFVPYKSSHHVTNSNGKHKVCQAFPSSNYWNLLVTILESYLITRVPPCTSDHLLTISAFQITYPRVAECVATLF